jgi:hypothetical protein
MKNTPTQLVPLAQFERSGRSPVNMRWLIFHEKESLQENGAIVRFGSSRWLVDEIRLIEWLCNNGSSFSTPSRNIN